MPVGHRPALGSTRGCIAPGFAQGATALWVRAVLPDAAQDRKGAHARCQHKAVYAPLHDWPSLQYGAGVVVPSTSREACTAGGTQPGAMSSLKKAWGLQFCLGALRHPSNPSAKCKCLAHDGAPGLTPTLIQPLHNP